MSKVVPVTPPFVCFSLIAPNHIQLLRKFWTSWIETSPHPVIIWSGIALATQIDYASFTACLFLCTQAKNQLSILLGASNPESIHFSCDCPSCRYEPNHPERIILREETDSLNIEGIRKAIQNSEQRPIYSSRRIVCIEAPEKLSPQAQNALLKTLEEPTASVLFFLLTERPENLLPTIRSRSILLRFPPSFGSQKIEPLAESSYPSIGQILQLPLHEKFKLAEEWSSEPSLTQASAMHYAKELGEKIRQTFTVGENMLGERKYLQHLFHGLVQLCQQADVHVNRRLLWENWLLQIHFQKKRLTNA